MKKLNSCPECKVSLDKINLRYFDLAWKDFKKVRLNSDFLVTGCSGCEEFFLTKGDSEKIDTLLESSIRKVTSSFLGRIKNACNQPQKVIARKIGLTEVYFSELIGKKKTPSYQTFNYLKILANHNETLKDLDNFEGTETTNDESLFDSWSRRFKYVKKDEILQYAERRQFENALTSKGYYH